MVRKRQEDITAEVKTEHQGPNIKRNGDKTEMQYKNTEREQQERMTRALKRKLFFRIFRFQLFLVFFVLRCAKGTKTGQQKQQSKADIKQKCRTRTCENSDGENSNDKNNDTNNDMNNDTNNDKNAEMVVFFPQFFVFNFFCVFRFWLREGHEDRIAKAKLEGRNQKRNPEQERITSTRENAR